MDIQQYDYTAWNGAFCTFGAHITHVPDRPVINLFALDENRTKSPLADHLWGVADAVLGTMFRGQFKRPEAQVTLTAGGQTTNIRFRELVGQPYQLSVSNKAVLLNERPASATLDDYRDNYRQAVGRPVPDYDGGANWYGDAQPYDVFAVPCAKARDGVFYARPPAYGTDRQGQHAYIMADTKKLIWQVNATDTAIMRHAQRRFNQIPYEDWLERNDVLHPCDTGAYAAGAGSTPQPTHLYCRSANTAVLYAASELGLPYLPIQVEKNGVQGRAMQRHDIESITETLHYFPANTRLPRLYSAFD